MTPARNSFGRRGLTPASFPVAAVAASAIPTSPRAQTVWNAAERRIVDHMPFLTLGLAFLLLGVFALECKFAIEPPIKGRIGLPSLNAFGAVSRDLVVSSGEWWRVFLAPLLHAGMSHLLGNCVALLFLGLRLEPVAGRSWFGATFVLGGLGGVAGSILGHPQSISSVGASGAISGLIGALFALGIFGKVEDNERAAMRKMALRFGAPALLPLLWGASDGTDYYAHLGGALAGATVALALGRRTERRDLFGLVVACVGLVGAMGAAGAARAHYPVWAEQARTLIPSRELPRNLRTDPAKADALLDRYPQDPRAHIVHALSVVQMRGLLVAETDLRRALALIPEKESQGGLSVFARAMLAAILHDRGRIAEARAMASGVCGARELPNAIADSLRKNGLCDAPRR